MASTPKAGSSTDDERRRLVRALAELPAGERRKVIADAHREAHRQTKLSWGSLRASRGVVTLGGDALVDCDNRLEQSIALGRRPSASFLSVRQASLGKENADEMS